MKLTLRPDKITPERVVMVSFIVDVSDIIFNLLVAWLSGSVIILSQTLEGVADLLASGLLLVGIKKSKRPSDRRHPYGYGRELYFWTFLAALATFVVTAGTSFYLGLERFMNPQPISNLYLTIIALEIAIITNGYSMSLSFRRLIGKRPREKIIDAFMHSALIETKTTFVLDLMGTVASVLGLAAIYIYKVTGDYRFDGLGAMAIGITLAVLAFFVLRSAKELLVGQAASPEVEEKIVKAVTSFENIRKVLDLRTLHLGPNNLLVNIEVHLADKLTTDEIEALIDKVEKGIKKEVPTATSIQIELETPDI